MNETSITLAITLKITTHHQLLVSDFARLLYRVAGLKKNNFHWTIVKHLLPNPPMRCLLLPKVGRLSSRDHSVTASNRI